MTTPDFTNNTGTGISFEVPVTLPSALGEVSSAIASGVADAGAPDPISVRRRWAIITAINTEDSTVDINLGGVVIPHVSYDATYHPALDEVVQVNVVDTDITVIGPTANSLYVGYIRREGTIVKVNTATGAPGAPTSVNVTLDDAQNPVTVLNVPFVSEYFPTVNDSVMLGQGTNTNVYLVLGAVNRTFRRPTGDIEPSLLTVAKPNTLLCQGQTVSRTTYAALWAWAQINGLSGAATTVTTDFEDGGTLTVGPNWTQTNSTARAQSGTRSLLLTRANTTSGNGYVSQTQTVTPGLTYSWSFWSYASSSIMYGCWIQLNHSNGTTTLRQVNASFTPTANTWLRYSFSFTVPANYTSATIYITDDFITPTTGTTLNIDNLSISTNNGFPFTTGDGSTTFTIPDFRGRVPIGAGSLNSDTYAVGGLAGAARVTLATNQMPAHNHSVSVDDHATHTHGITVNSGGAHTHSMDFESVTGMAPHTHDMDFQTHFMGISHAHNFTTAQGGDHIHAMQNPRYTTIGGHTHIAGANTVSEGPDTVPGAEIYTRGSGTHNHGGTTDGGDNVHQHRVLGTTTQTSGGTLHGHRIQGDTASGGGHSHTGSAGSGGPTTHTVNQTTVGGTTAIDIRQPILCVQFLIWT